MPNDLLIAPLLRVALFHGLKPLQISEIARRAERVMFRQGATIAQRGEEADAAILIVAGEAVRTQGPELDQAMEPVPEGSLVGEMAMVVETEHTSTVVAKGPVKALRLSRAQMLEQLAADPDLAEHLVSKILGRLKVLAEDLRQIDNALAGSDDDANGSAPAHRTTMFGGGGANAAETRH